MRIGRIHCGRIANVCSKLHISRYPLFALFKPGGGYEIHHGKEGAHDVANFVRQSRSAPNMRVLSPDEFLEKTQGSNMKFSYLSIESRLPIICTWFNRFAAQPLQCIFKEFFSVSHLFKCMPMIASLL